MKLVDRVITSAPEAAIFGICKILLLQIWLISEKWTFFLVLDVFDYVLKVPVPGNLQTSNKLL
jgi:hypothetical protein